MNAKEIKDLDNVEMLSDNDNILLWSSGLGKMVKMLVSKLPFIRKDKDETAIDGNKLFRGVFGTLMETRQHVGFFTFAGGDTGNAVNVILRPATGNIGGTIKVRVTSGYRGASAYGSVEKVFDVYYLSSTNSLFVANTLVPQCSKACGEQWGIGDIAAVDGNLVITIVNRTGKSNDVRISVEMIKYITSIPEITLSDPYTYTGVVPNNLTELVYHPGDLARLRNDMKTEYSFSCPVGEEINTNLKLNGLIQFKTNLYTGYSLLANWSLSSLLADPISAHPTVVLGSLDSAGKVCIGKKETNGNLFIVNKTTSQQIITIRVL